MMIFMVMIINIHVKSRFFQEDTTIADPNRAVAGIGPGARDEGNIDVNVPAEADKGNSDAPKILPFQIANSVPVIANYITELMTMNNNLEQYASSSDTPAHKREVVNRLTGCIKKINTIFARDVIRLLDKLAL